MIFKKKVVKKAKQYIYLRRKKTSVIAALVFVLNIVGFVFAKLF